jgi:hypothetical protein
VFVAARQRIGAIDRQRLLTVTEKAGQGLGERDVCRFLVLSLPLEPVPLSVSASAFVLTLLFFRSIAEVWSGRASPQTALGQGEDLPRV